MSGNRRIDRIKSDGFVTGLDGLDITEVRRRRDECRDELDHLSMLRRYLQSRAGVLKAEAERRAGGDTSASLIDSLAEILAGEGPATRVGRRAASRLRGRTRDARRATASRRWWSRPASRSRDLTDEGSPPR